MDVRKIKLPSKKEDWLAVRRLGVTGTDLAGIAGVSRFATPLSVYLDKRGELPALEVNEAMEIGTYMEDPIAKLWQQRNPGVKIQKVNAILQHTKHDWMLGNIDRLITAPNKAILEVKNVGAFAGVSWGDDEDEDIPKEYYLQLMWYLTVCGMKNGTFAALIGGNRLIERHIEYDKEFGEQLIEMAHDFWLNNVLSGNPPPIDGSEVTGDLISAMFNDPHPILVDIPQAEYWVQQKYDREAQMKEIEKQVDEAKNNIKFLIGDADEALCGKYHSSWKKIVTNKFDTKAFKQDHPELHNQYLKESSYRRLTTKKRRTD